MKNYLEKVCILEGVILGILGVLFFTNPIESFLNFTLICGIFIVIAGIMRLVRGFKSTEKLYLILTAIIDIIFGLIIWFYPIATTANLILILGIWAFIKGIYNVIIYIKNKDFGFNGRTFLAIVSVILGGVIFICPLVAIAILPFIPYIIGVYLIVVAVSEIYIGFKIK